MHTWRSGRGSSISCKEANSKLGQHELSGIGSLHLLPTRGSAEKDVG